jgi:hypothetical protein
MEQTFARNPKTVPPLFVWLKALQFFCSENLDACCKVVEDKPV